MARFFVFFSSLAVCLGLFFLPQRGFSELIKVPGFTLKIALKIKDLQAGRHAFPNTPEFLSGKYAPKPVAARSQKRAEQAIAVLQEWYDEESGIWNTTSWWNAANAITSLAQYTKYTGSRKYMPVIRNTFAKTRHFPVEASADRPAWVCHNYLNDYYDDAGWWALAWLDVYELDPDTAYLNVAKIIFADMAGGWDEVCGGGTYWKKPDIGKGAISNGLLLNVALRLWEQEPDEKVQGLSYQQWAYRIWEWFRASGMISPDNLILNGLKYREDCSPHGTPWTYNQGVMVGALTIFYQQTQDSSYLHQAEAIAEATMATLVHPNGVLRDQNEANSNGDQIQFKGIFMRYLGRLYETSPKPEYAAFIRKNARSIWKIARDRKTGRIGASWALPFDQGSAARQSSAVDALNGMILVDAK